MNPAVVHALSIVASHSCTDVTLLNNAKMNNGKGIASCIAATSCSNRTSE